jgi:hypothetical protein
MNAGVFNCVGRLYDDAHSKLKKKKKWNNLNMGAVLGFDPKTKKKLFL